jgi:hypothetical protein
MSWQYWVLLFWLAGAIYLVIHEVREGSEISLGDLVIMIIFGGIFAPLMLWEKLPGRVLKIARTIGSVRIVKARDRSL